MIEIQKLSKSFNRNIVLNELSLNVQTGQTCVIIGRSGCGKSVLLKHIVGLLIPDSGKVLVQGKDVAVLLDAGEGGDHLQAGGDGLQHLHHADLARQRVHGVVEQQALGKVDEGFLDLSMPEKAKAKPSAITEAVARSSSCTSAVFA